MNRRHLLSSIALFAIAAVSPWAGAADGTVVVEGASFDRRIRLLDSELQLNGTGVRAVAWFKAYAVALYLGAPAGNAAQAVAANGPKRLRIRMLTEAPAVEFSKAFRKGLMRNVPGPQAATALEARVSSFEEGVNALGKVHKGDTIDLDYDPKAGTSLWVNGTLRHGPTAGDDFYAALLRSFVGEQPYDEKMRAGLLGQAS